MGLFGKSKEELLLGAAKCGELREVRAALNKGASVNCKDWHYHYYTPLHWAADCGHVSVCLVLLEKGADIEAKSHTGSTPLKLAANGGHASLCMALLEKGADVNTKDRFDSTPLDAAASNGRRPSHDYAPLCTSLLEKGAEVNTKDHNGRTPLHNAARNGRASACTVLLENGADTNTTDHEGRTPLHYAALGGYGSACTTLLKNGANVHSKNHKGDTPLHYAAYGSHLSICTALLEQGADITAKNEEGKMAMDCTTDEAARAALSVKAVPHEATPDHGSAVPADVAALLSRLSLSSYGPALCDKLGAKSVTDLRHLTDVMLREELPALRAIERAKLLDAVASTAAAPAGTALTTMCDVMISYRVLETGEDGDKSVFALEAALQARGYRVFVGEAAIQGGSSWPNTIQQGVEDCKAFVVLCSETYGDEAVSPWTKRELVLADNLKKPLIPVWHSGPYPPKAVAIYLGGTQRIPHGNFSGGYVNADISHERVAEELAAALSRLGVAPART